MTRNKNLAIVVVALFAMTACGSDKAEEPAAGEVDVATTAPDVSFRAEGDKLSGPVVTPGAPYRVNYRIIGTPVVGSPVTVDLRISSLRGPRPTRLDFRVKDPSSMLFAESQPASVQLEAAANETEFSQQVTIIPQREGRFYLNVSASYETEDGTMSTITAIPIQVGAGTRELQEHGELQVDEDGNAVRVLTGD